MNECLFSYVSLGCGDAREEGGAWEEDQERKGAERDGERGGCKEGMRWERGRKGKQRGACA